MEGKAGAIGAFGACKELIGFWGESPIQGHLLYHILCTPSDGQHRGPGEGDCGVSFSVFLNHRKCCLGAYLSGLAVYGRDRNRNNPRSAAEPA